MGKLADLLKQPTAETPVNTTVSNTSFDDQGNYTQAFISDVQPKSTEDLLRKFGHDPDKFTVDGNVSVSHRELVDGRTVSTYRYKLVGRLTPARFDDIADRVLNAPTHTPVKSVGDQWFVFQAGDSQIGKRSSGGATEEILERYFQSVNAAVAELQGYGDQIAGVQLSFPGDCIEGVVSQGGRNAWLTQETITEQTRIFRRLLMATVEAFAPLADKVYVDVVQGNHDEAQRQFNTYPGDGWATEAAIAVSDALKLNPDAYGHVEVRVPDKWFGYMTVPVGDTNVTVVHGHQFGRQSNAMRWWQEQVFGGHNPSTAHILQNGHFHECAWECAGERSRIQSPTFDCGSDWFREKHGVGNVRGALTYLLKSGKVSKLGVV